MIWYEVIRDMRLERGESYNQLTRNTIVDYHMWGRIEQGKTKGMRVDWLVSLAAYWGYHPYELMVKLNLCEPEPLPKQFAARARKNRDSQTTTAV